METKHISHYMNQIINDWLDDEKICRSMPDDVRQYFIEQIKLDVTHER